MSDNPFAFPSPDVLDANGCGIREGSLGMTLRDYFAAQAMIALHSRGAGTPPDCRKESLLADADVFYAMADAMLEVRGRS